MLSSCHDVKNFIDLAVFERNDGQNRTEQLVLYDLVVLVDRIQHGRRELLRFSDPFSAEIHAVAVFRLEYVNSDGKKERIYNAIGYNAVTQIMSGNWKFETLDDEGNVISERVRPVTMRQTYRQEMKWLIELCGFELVDVYRDYKCTKADENITHNLIWVMRKKFVERVEIYEEELENFRV